jgi:hypothetical protein
MTPSLNEFILHNYASRWQDLQCHECLENLTHDIVLLCVDFSKNYALKIQNEIQGMHWHNFQMSILVHISYLRNPTPDPIDAESKIIKEVHYFIFDDTSHDTLYVQHAFMFH